MHKANMNFGHYREPITSARKAAEALFAPKPEAEGQSLSDPEEPVAARKPRVLPALSPMPIRWETIDVTAAPSTSRRLSRSPPRNRRALEPLSNTE
jgi:hypothetical protein